MNKQSRFTSPGYGYALGALIFGLLAYNFWILISTQNLRALIPIALQSVLGFLLVTSSRWLRTAIRIWSIVIGGSAFVGLLANLLAFIINRENEIESEYLIGKAVSIVLGLLLWMFASNEIYIENKGDIGRDESGYQ